MSILKKLNESLDSNDVQKFKRLGRVLTALDENVDTIEELVIDINFLGDYINCNELLEVAKDLDNILNRLNKYKDVFSDVKMLLFNEI